jgi:hypothetical protein
MATHCGAQVLSSGSPGSERPSLIRVTRDTHDQCQHREDADHSGCNAPGMASLHVRRRRRSTSCAATSARIGGRGIGIRSQQVPDDGDRDDRSHDQAVTSVTRTAHSKTNAADDGDDTGQRRGA